MIILEFSNTVINNPYKCKGIAKALSAWPGDTALPAINFNLFTIFA